MGKNTKTQTQSSGGELGQLLALETNRGRVKTHTRDTRVSKWSEQHRRTRKHWCVSQRREKPWALPYKIELSGRVVPSELVLYEELDWQELMTGALQLQPRRIAPATPSATHTPQSTMKRANRNTHRNPNNFISFHFKPLFKLEKKHWGCCNLQWHQVRNKLIEKKIANNSKGKQMDIS